MKDNLGMNAYKRHRFPSNIISYAVWLYYRFNLSRHLVSAKIYRLLRLRAFAPWEIVVA